LLGVSRNAQMRTVARILDDPAQKSNRLLRLGCRVADTESMLRYDVELVDRLGPEAAGEGDLSFAVFSLAHAECGDHVLEVRIGERMLLGWCTGCAVMEVFGPYER
jgi:hypothetical protein